MPKKQSSSNSKANSSSPNNESFNRLIISELIKNPDQYFSGSTLAKTLKTSRVTIWNHLSSLKKDGFAFEAIKNKGYRLLKSPLTLHPTLLSAHLLNLDVKESLFFFNELDSTQNEAERLLSHHQLTPFAVVAKKQTQGRGRRGRTWVSAFHNNLYISFAFEPNLSPHTLQTFSLWIGLNICHLLNSLFNIPIKIKWPNDLVLQGKKVAGFLAEARIDADHTRDLILGIGLNINGSTTTFPKDLQPKATTLETFTGKPLDMNLITAHLIQTTLQAYRDFMHSKTSHFKSLWTEYDHLKDQPITVYRNEEKIHGAAKGVDPNGNLILQLPNGTFKHFNTAEVTLSQPT